MRLALLTACVCALAASVPSAQSPAPGRTRPLKSLDLGIIDSTVDACTNFYGYACGGWRKNNPVPGDKARFGRFDELRELNLWTLKDILDDAAKPGETRTPIQAQVGDFYASCMDQAAIDAAGLQPIDADLSRDRRRPRPRRICCASWEACGATASTRCSRWRWARTSRTPARP